MFGSNKEKRAEKNYHYYEEGLAAENREDWNEAFRLYTLAAEGGVEDAYFKLGYCYDCEKGTDKNITKAIYWYEKALDNGDQVAAYNLGIKYYYGDGVEKSYEKAFRYFKRSVDFDCNYGYYMLAFCYLDGKGVDRDKRMGIKLLEKSAERGDPRGINALGCYYYDNANNNADKTDEYCLPIDRVKAYELFKKAADLGNDYAKENLKNLEFPASCYTKLSADKYRQAAKMTEAIQKLKTESVQPFNASAGNSYSAPKKSAKELEDEGVDDIYAGRTASGIAKLEAAAEAGSIYARCMLGDFYADGSFGVEKNTVLARYWYNSVLTYGSGSPYASNAREGLESLK